MSENRKAATEDPDVEWSKFVLHVLRATALERHSLKPLSVPLPPLHFHLAGLAS